MSATDYWIKNVREGIGELNRKWKLNQKYIPAIITVLFGLAFVWLLVSLYIGSTVFGFENADDISIGRIVEVFTQPGLFSIFYNTLVIGVIGGGISTILGAYFAWIVVRTNAPGRRVIRFLALAPMALPFLTAAIGWVGVFSPRIGVIPQWTENVLGVTFPFDLYSLEGIIVVASFSGFYLSYLLLEPPLTSLPSSYEEAAKASGASVPTIFFKITMPLLLPALMSSFLLNTIYLFGNFEYPFIFGASNQIDTFATAIYSAMNDRIFPQYDLATIYSMFYIFTALVLIAAYKYVARKSHRFTAVSGRTERNVRLDLGKWRYVATGSCLFISVFTLGVPLFGVFGLAFASNPSGFFTQFDFSNFAAFFELAGIRRVTETTLLISTVSAAAVVFFSLFISYTGLKLDVKYVTNSSDYIASIPLGLPPIVYSVAVFWLIMLSPARGLYGTIWPLIIAVTFLKIPHGVRMISSNLIQISDELEDAARVSGGTWLTNFRKIVVPLVKNGIANVFLFTFIDVAKEVAAIILLVTAGNQVLMGLLLLMWEQNPSQLPIIAAASIIFTVVLAGLTAVQAKVGSYHSADQA